MVQKMLKNKFQESGRCGEGIAAPWRGCGVHMRS